MFKYIIGIDGGGTKTLGVLYDLDGNEIKRHELGFSNFSVDQELAKTTIRQLIKILMKDINDKVFVQMGIAGASRLQNKEEFLNELESEFNIKTDLQTDAHIALYSTPIDDDEKLIMAIGGTGSIVMTYDHKQTHRLGGWGHLLGDEGSAYHLSIEAVKNILKEYEERKQYSLLSNLLLNKMNAKNPSHIIEFIYNNAKSKIALLSIEVQKAAKENDIVALRLLKEQGEHLSRQILNAYNLYLKEGKIVVSLRGSFAQKAYKIQETVLNNIKKQIKEVRFDIDAHEPVYGAYRLGIVNMTGEKDGRH